MNNTLKKAIEFHQSGNFEKAEKFYLRLLRSEKKINRSELQQLLGTLYLQNKKLDKARLHLELSFNSNPNNPFTINNLGLLEFYNKNNFLALKYFDQNIEANNFYESYINKLNLFIQEKSYEECIKYCNIYLQRFKDDQKIKNILAVSLAHNGDSEVSMQIFKELLSQKNVTLETFFNYSLCLYNLGERQSALNIINFYIKNCRTNDNAFYHRHLVLKSLKKYKEAEADLNNALNISNKFKYKKSIIQLHEGQNNFYEVKKNCDFFLIKEKNEENKKFLISKRLLSDLYTGNFLSFLNYSHSPEKTLLESKKTFKPLDLISVCDEPAILKNFNSFYWSKNIEKLNINKKKIKTNIIKNKKTNRIKIGFFSGDFRNHAVAHLIKDLFYHFDKSKFELFAFSSFCKKDEIRDEIKKNFNFFYDLDNISNEEILSIVKSADLDIAVDLSGYTQYQKSWLFGFDIAKKKINYLGYPGTMGSNQYDFIIADKYIIPEDHKKFYSEKVIYMPETYQPFSILKLKNKNVTRENYNLPENCFLLVSFARIEKILPNIFDVWMRILKSYSNTKLCLFIRSDDIKNNIKLFCNTKKYDFNNIIFLDKKSHLEHLSRLSLLDLYLDTFPYNSHTLMSDALFHSGIPAVSMTGKSFASRVSLSLLNYANLKECAVGSEEEYFLKIKEIINDKDYYNNLKNKLNEKRKLVSNRMVNFTKDFEKIMIQILNV
jgi:protein O-GlcNAc transferase